MCSLKLPPQVLKQIDIYRKHCLYGAKVTLTEGELVSLLGKQLANRKKQGGLGIIDIKHQNDVLLMKHLDKFYSSSDLPWVTLTWNKFYSNSQTPPQA